MCSVFSKYLTLLFIPLENADFWKFKSHSISNLHVKVTGNISLTTKNLQFLIMPRPDHEEEQRDIHLEG